jgi:hypothetical protein
VTPFNLNAHGRTLFSHLDENNVHFIGQHCPIWPLKFNIIYIMMEAIGQP